MWKPEDLPRQTPTILGIMNAITAAPPEGLMVDDVARTSGQDTNVIAPRFLELERAGWIEKSGVRGRTSRGATANRFRLSAKALA